MAGPDDCRYHVWHKWDENTPIEEIEAELKRRGMKPWEWCISLMKTGKCALASDNEFNGGKRWPSEHDYCIQLLEKYGDASCFSRTWIS
jgi:hypothetical protein